MTSGLEGEESETPEKNHREERAHASNRYCSEPNDPERREPPQVLSEVPRVPLGDELDRAVGEQTSQVRKCVRRVRRDERRYSCKDDNGEE